MYTEHDSFCKTCTTLDNRSLFCKIPKLIKCHFYAKYPTWIVQVQSVYKAKYSLLHSDSKSWFVAYFELKKYSQILGWRKIHFFSLWYYSIFLERTLQCKTNLKKKPWKVGYLSSQMWLIKQLCIKLGYKSHVSLSSCWIISILVRHALLLPL